MMYSGKFHGDTAGGGEFSWGAGLTAPGEDGLYCGMSPAMEQPAGLAALSEELAERATYPPRRSDGV